MRRIWKTLYDSIRLFWRGLDQARRFVVNVVFLVLLVAGVAWWLADRRPQVPDGSALVVAPYGDLVEQLTGAPEDQALLALLGERRPETLLRTLLEALEAARDDERIEVLLLDLDRLGGAGLSKLQTLRRAIQEFKNSGKPVIATGDFYSQPQYYLAAAADEIYLHPMGVVLLTGYGSYRNYYKEALDRLAIDWHVYRVGEYKSAVEPYLRNDMSPEAREARQRWLSLLWESYAQEVEQARGLEAGTVQRYASEFAAGLERHGGDAAELARSVGLVTHVAHRDELRQQLIDRLGRDDEGESFRQIDHQSYWRAVKKPAAEGGGRVAVVVAKGPIYDGSQLPGAVGGDSTSRLIRQAREDESVAAVVLRVDSPGGSAFASELIRREVQLTRDAGKPVVASLSSVAASGGYWISMSADEIWAAPTTLTGSIGIYAMLPTFSRSLAKLGIRNDGVGTGELAGTVRLDRPIPPTADRALELLIEQGYREFIEGVAAGRGKTLEEADLAARGRVWAGTDALRLGLVDDLGDLEEAIAAAARLAELGEDYRAWYVEPEAGWRQRLLGWLVASLGERWAGLPSLSVFLPPLSVGVEELIGDTVELVRYRDPNGLYAYCFCDPN